VIIDIILIVGIYTCIISFFSDW